MQKRINGKSILIFIGGKAIALTTDTSLDVSSDTIDAASKDDGLWDAGELGNLKWSATNDSFYCVGDDSSPDMAGDALLEATLSREPVTVIIGTPKNDSPDEVPATGWTAPSGAAGEAPAWTGEAYITQFSLKATNGQKATCNLTLTGHGGLKKVTA